MFNNFFKKLFNKIEIHTIRTKLIISFLIIGLLPILLSGLLSFNIWLCQKIYEKVMLKTEFSF